MKFFVPIAKDKAQEDEVYEGIKKFVTSELGASLSTRKIFSLTHREGKGECLAEVGKKYPLSGEVVFAILYDRTRSLYCICTPNRGVFRGIPFLCGAGEVIFFEDFDP